MSEELNLSKDFLEKAKNRNNAPKKKNKNVTRWVITLGLAVIFIVAFVFAMTKWFTPTNFEEKISLDKQISRWDNLAWDATGGFTGDNLKTKYGDWSFDNTNGVFTGEKEYAACSFYFNKLKNPEANKGTDQEETVAYTKTIFEGTDFVKKGTVWVDFKKDNKVVTEVELVRNDFIDPDGNYTAAYYRVSPMNGAVLFGTVRCETEEQLNTLVPDDSNTQIEDLGIALKMD